MRLNIKDKLDAKNMSRYELAKRIGVTYPTITSIYNGDSTSIKLDILEALCKELDCTPSEIITTENEKVENNIEYERLSSELIKTILEKVGGSNGTITIHSPITITLNKEKQTEILKALEILAKKNSAINNEKDDI